MIPPLLYYCLCTVFGVSARAVVVRGIAVAIALGLRVLSSLLLVLLLRCLLLLGSFVILFY